MNKYTNWRIKISDIDKEEIIFSELKSNKIKPEIIDEMYKIYNPHHNMSFDAFQSRMHTNFNRIILFKRDLDKELIGFTGIRFDKFITNKNKKRILIYYGSAFLESEYRGKNLMQTVGKKYYLKIRLKHLMKKIYVWADLLSLRAYCMICSNYRRFYPSPDWETPKKIKKLMDYVGEKYYGDNYNSESGIVCKNSKRIKDHEISYSEGDRKDKYVNFFLDKNEDYLNGNGLICVIPANIVNILSNAVHTLKKRR